MFEFDLFEIYNLKEMSLSTEVFLSCSILQLTFYAIATTQQRKHGFVILSQQIYHIGALIIGLSTLLLFNEDLFILNSFSSNNFIINDYLGFASKLVICVISFMFLLLITISYEDKTAQNNFEYIVLILISVLGLLLLCSSNDLITAYLSIELQSVAFYIMAAFKRNSTYSIESGLKYFIIGSLSSAFFLFGSALIYGCAGSLNFDDLRMFISLLLVSPAQLEAVNIDFFNLSTFSLFVPLELFYLYFEALKLNGVINSIDLTSYCVDHTDDLINHTAYNSGLDSLIVSESSSSEIYNLDLFYTSELSNSLNLLFTDLGFSLSEKLTVYTDTVSSDGIQLLNYILGSYLESVTASFNTLDGSSLNLDLIYLGFILLCISLFIKLALAPFHLWSLDVYEGSPNTTTIFFAVVPKMALFVLLIRICYSSFYCSFSSNWQFYFFIVALLSVFIGSFGGLEQRKLKSLLAYSSVSHTGYLLLSFSTNSLEGMSMMLYYLVIFMVSSLCFWSIYLFVQHKKDFYFKKHNKELGDLILLRDSNSLLALILAITLFSIAGIPPIVGFLAKLGVFLVVIKSSAYIVSLIAILFSVASTFYYIRVIKILYFENVLVGKLYVPISTKKSLLIAILAILLIVLCIDPTIIYYLFQISNLMFNY